MNLKRSLRFFTLLFFTLSFSTCDYFSFERKKNAQELDTIVDKSTVDVFPSFAVCHAIIDKEKKANCFRETIHSEIATSLGEQEIKVKKPVNETVEVIITVHSDHRLVLKSLNASEEIIAQIPDLEERIKKSIEDLPKVHAAIKRGIPVTSEYKLPIQIKIED